MSKKDVDFIAQDGENHEIADQLVDTAFSFGKTGDFRILLI